MSIPSRVSHNETKSCMLKSHRGSEDLLGEITVDQKGVLKLLNNLKIHTSKASGQDGLSAWVLKDCSSEISPILTLFHNVSFAQDTLPDNWRQANVTPTFKKGEKYNAAIDQCRLFASVAKT